jgi:hypothetical protein
MSRGRPKEVIQEKQNKFTRHYENNDGTKEIWYYDSIKTTHGPIKVEITYTSKWVDPIKQAKLEKKLAKKKKK